MAAKSALRETSSFSEALMSGSRVVLMKLIDVVAWALLCTGWAEASVLALVI